MRRIAFHYTTTNAFRSFAAEGILHYRELPGNQLFPDLANAVTSNTVVIIAPFYAAGRDFFRVPKGFGDENGEMRGGYLLAFAIRTLLNGSGGKDVGRWTSHFITACAFACGFGFVFIQLLWPRSGVCDWRFLPPMGYLSLAAVLVMFNWFLPVTLPFVAYMLGHHLGELYLAKFGCGHEPVVAPSASVEPPVASPKKENPTPPSSQSDVS